MDIVTGPNLTHGRRRIKALLVRQCPEAADDGRAEHVRSARVD